MSRGLDDRKPSLDKKELPEEGLDFLLWKAELNKELYLFWKSLFGE